MTEMNNLIKLLAKADIPFEIIPFSMPCMDKKCSLQVRSPSSEDCKIDAVCHNYSYGGDRGLIEVMGDCVRSEEGDSVRGWLTAEQAFEYFKKANEA